MYTSFKPEWTFKGIIKVHNNAEHEQDGFQPGDAGKHAPTGALCTGFWLIGTWPWRRALQRRRAERSRLTCATCHISPSYGASSFTRIPARQTIRCCSHDGQKKARWPSETWLECTCCISVPWQTYCQGLLRRVRSRELQCLL